MSIQKEHDQIIYDGFASIDVSARNLVRWLDRNSILEALRKAYPLVHGSLIDIGCVKIPYKAKLCGAQRKGVYWLGLRKCTCL
jgi:hypothetical protein